jgi:cell division protein FtsI (penicillin-binding protein 3)
MAIQHMVERELDRAMRETRARAASAIVLDPATGEVLALANRPTADPNHYGHSTPDQRRNRAVVEVYEPGSTFKVVTAAALLDAGAVVPSETIHCENGAFAFAGRRIRDHHPYGLLTFREILEHSSNIGMVKAGGRLAHHSMHGYVSAFGFGRRTGIELPGEVSGLLAQAARWTPSTRASVSFGHEIGVTVLQMASAFAAVANDGELVPPRIVLGFRDAAGTVHPAPSAEPRRVISSRTAAVLTELLEGVVERGTGKSAQIPGYRIAGKTGTAQKVIPKVGYSTTEHMASFAGYGPVRRPRIACLVVLDTPAGGVHTGGLTAAPVFARIVSEALAYLRVPPDEDVLIERRKRLEQEAAERRLKDLARRRRQSRERPDHPPEEATEGDAEPLVTGPGQAPDLRGMSLRDAIASLVRRGLRVSATGSGVVVEQNPPPGSSITDGQMCALRLAPEPLVRR